MAINSSIPLAFAGRDQIDTAKGIMMVNYTLEKCKGNQTPDNILKKQAKTLRGQGVTANEIAQGFDEGLIQVEFEYPGKKKPPKSECDKAQYLYNELLKFL